MHVLKSLSFPHRKDGKILIKKQQQQQQSCDGRKHMSSPRLVGWLVGSLVHCGRWAGAPARTHRRRRRRNAPHRNAIGCLPLGKKICQTTSYSHDMIAPHPGRQSRMDATKGRKYIYSTTRPSRRRHHLARTDRR